MNMTQDGSSQSELRSNKTGVISCRLPFQLKLAAEQLTRSNGVVLSHLLREFLEETVNQGDPHWWRKYAVGKAQSAAAKTEE